MPPSDQRFLVGFYILDPWYGWGGGAKPNSWVTVSTWNSSWFTKETASNIKPWYNNYVVVLRSANGNAPAYPPPQSYGDYVYSQTAAAVVVDPSTRTFAAPVVSTDLGQAVIGGMRQAGLESGGALGVDLTGFSLGSSVHVDSLVAEEPSYELVRIKVGNQVRALAMATDTDRGYAFAGVTTYVDGLDVASPSAVDSALASAGMKGPARLVWAWTDEGNPPFVPFVEAHDAASGASAYLSAGGKRASLHLDAGQTPLEG